MRLEQVQFSPTLPGRYRDASLPVGVFRFVAEHTGSPSDDDDGDDARQVSVLLSFQNPLASVDVAPLDTSPPRDRWRVNHRAGEEDEDERRRGVAAGGPLAHASFARRAFSQPTEGSKNATVRVAGVSMTHDGRSTPGRPPRVAPWRGGFAIAAEVSPGVDVTARTAFDAASEEDLGDVWDAFESRGRLEEDFFDFSGEKASSSSS